MNHVADLSGQAATPALAVPPLFAPPALTIVVPSFNERANVEPLVAAVRDAMGDVPWEMIVVDDDSPDRTFDEVRRVAQSEPRVRCLRRIGRRGLSSAVIEGALGANADVIAVMDADFQHDERILPKMLAKLRDEQCDLVVATRYAGGGGVGEWDEKRQKMSDLATRMSRLIVGDQTSDPMSGFFMVRRSAFTNAIYGLSQQGYKILLDIISSSPHPLKIGEVPYTFRDRREGESKISLTVLAEFAYLLIEKLTRGLIPGRFVLFAAVGGLGLFVHMAILFAGKSAGFGFLTAQSLAIMGAMIFNFTLNNEVTYRDRRLVGHRFFLGLAIFCVVCSIGAIANVGVADLAIQRFNSWSIAGIVGALMGAVFNFGAASSLVWNRKRKRVAATDMVETVA